MSDEENREILNTLAKGAGITAFGMFFSKAITYFYRALVGRALGPEAYGQLSIGIMIVGIAATLSGDPVRNGLKKFIPEYREEGDTASIKGMVLSALQINLLGSILVGGTIYLTAPWIATQIFHSAELVPIIRIMGLVPLIGRPYDIFIDTTIAFNKAKYKVISTNIVQNLTQLAVTSILIIPIGMGVMGAIWGWVLAVALTLPLAFYYMERKVGPILTKKVKPVYHRKKLFKFSYPLMLSGIIATVLNWTDTAFLGYFMTESAVGLYNAAFPTALLILIPHQAIGQLAITSFSELGAKDRSKEEMLKTSARWVFALTFPTFLIMTLFSSELLTLLFGKQYATAGTALAILALGHLVNTAVGRVGSLMKSSGYTKIIFYNSTANLAANIILNILLIPPLGIIGAAIATSGSIIVMSFLLTAEVYRFEKIHAFSREMLKTVLASSIALGATYLFVNHAFTTTPYWALIPAGVIFYTLYISIFGKIGGLKEYDREIILTLGRKSNQERKVKKILNLLT
jgi:O-antigen/teichoic acid export membrane protein